MESELLIKVLLATIFGFLGGWLVRGVFAGTRFRRAEQDWTKQLEVVKQARDASSTKVRTLRSRIGEMESSFGSVEKQMTRFRESMEERERSIQALRQNLFDAKEKIDEVDRLRAALADRDEKLSQFTRMRAELLRASAQATEAEGMRAELETAVARATQLEADNAGLLEEKAQQRAGLDQLREQNHILQEQVKQVAVAPHDPSPELQQQVQSQHAQIQVLQRELKVARDLAASPPVPAPELEVELEDKNAQIQSLTQELKAAREVAAAGAELALESETAELEARIQAQDQTISELKEALEKAQQTPAANPAPGPASSDGGSASVQALREQLAASRELLSQYQQRVNQLEQSSRGTQAVASPPPQVRSSAQRDIASPEDVPLFYERPPAQVDDLTRIKGIGPVLATTLNSMGIFQFRQLANMSSEDIETVTRRLQGFKDRIRRDDWVRQARELV